MQPPKYHRSFPLVQSYVHTSVPSTAEVVREARTIELLFSPDSMCCLCQMCDHTQRVRQQHSKIFHLKSAGGSFADQRNMKSRKKEMEVVIWTQNLTFVHLQFGIQLYVGLIT